MMGSFSKIPAGNIPPCRFVVLGTVPGTCVLSGANGNIWGISQPGTRAFPLPGLDENLAGKAGDGPINIIGPGDDEGLLELGGTVTYGQTLKSDADGKGIAGVADRDRCGAIALSAGTNGQRIKVKPIRLDISIA